MVDQLTGFALWIAETYKAATLDSYTNENVALQTRTPESAVLSVNRCPPPVGCLPT